jgi:hypothetical protein
MAVRHGMVDGTSGLATGAALVPAMQADMPVGMADPVRRRANVARRRLIASAGRMRGRPLRRGAASGSTACTRWWRRSAIPPAACAASC